MEGNCLEERGSDGRQYYNGCSRTWIGLGKDKDRKQSLVTKEMIKWVP